MNLTRQIEEKTVTEEESYVDMNQVVTIILGGGEGKRMFPLTQTRCKPAVSFGGRYRLIDIPVSNAINSHCHKIFIVTQFLSSYLHRHIFQTYRPDMLSSGFIDVLAAEQKPMSTSWYQGTADAVRRNIEYLIDTPGEYFLILSGDQLYHMDFRKMVGFARKNDAELVIASKTVDQSQVGRLGILQIDDDQFVTDFVEKPSTEKELEGFTLSPRFNDFETDTYLGSMGIYLFKRKALIDLLLNDSREDFGKHLIPTQMKAGGVAAYIHEGYWEDIGTIGAYHEANLDLTRDLPKFNLYDDIFPIYTSRSDLPATKIRETEVNHSILCEGGIISASRIEGSVIGPRSVIKEGSVVKNSYIIGNNFYASPVPFSPKFPEKMEIGENCRIENAIVDKNVLIGKNVKLINKNALQHYDSRDVYIREGVIIVRQGAFLPDGFEL